VLLFCQMKRMLDVIDDMLDEMSIPHARLDGDTDGEDRPGIIDDFNREGSTTNVFLLSTRAGGMGINLQSADTVILVESDWNPAADLQAVSRVQRIGQKKTVHVMRLVTHRQIDEVIIQRAREKQRTEAIAVGAGKFSSGSDHLQSLRQQDITKLLEELDAVEPAFDEQVDIDGEVLSDKVTPLLEAPPVDVLSTYGLPRKSTSTQAAVSVELAAVPGTAPARSDSADVDGTLGATDVELDVNANNREDLYVESRDTVGRKSVDSASTVPFLDNSVAPAGIGPSNVSSAENGCQLSACVVEPPPSPSLKPCKEMQRYAAEWDQLLLRQGEESLPVLTNHTVMPLATASQTIPAWLKTSGPDAEYVLAGLKADSPTAAANAVQKAKDDAAIFAGQGKLDRGSRKARFAVSLAELGSSESDESLYDDNKSSDEDGGRSRPRPAGSRGNGNEKRRSGKDACVTLVSSDSEDVYEPSEYDSDEDDEDVVVGEAVVSLLGSDVPQNGGDPCVQIAMNSANPAVVQAQIAAGTMSAPIVQAVHLTAPVGAKHSNPPLPSPPGPAPPVAVAISSGGSVPIVDVPAALRREIVPQRELSLMRAPLLRPQPVAQPVPAEALCSALLRLGASDNNEDSSRQGQAPPAVQDATDVLNSTAVALSQPVGHSDFMGGDLDRTTGSQPVFITDAIASPVRGASGCSGNQHRYETDTLKLELSFRKELQNRRMRTSLRPTETRAVAQPRDLELRQRTLGGPIVSLGNVELASKRPRLS
jgi:Helicase conserved C-terminal domain